MEQHVKWFRRMALVYTGCLIFKHVYKCESERNGNWRDCKLPERKGEYSSGTVSTPELPDMTRESS